MANAILLVFCNWLSLWDMRSIQSWDLASIAVQFLFAVSVYVICALIGPKVPDEGPIDLEEFFWRQRPYFYGAVLAFVLLALVANLDFLKTTNASLFIKENLTTLPMLIPVGLALLSRARWAQWVAGLLFFAMVIVFTIMFSITLS